MRLGLAVALGVALTTVSVLTATAAPPQRTDPTNPDFGPNVTIFDPSMDTSAIQAKFDEIHARQVGRANIRTLAREAVILRRVTGLATQIGAAGCHVHIVPLVRGMAGGQGETRRIHRLY